MRKQSVCALLMCSVFVVAPVSAEIVKLKNVQIKEINRRWSADKHRFEIVIAELPPASNIVVANDDGSEGATTVWNCTYGVSMKKIGIWEDDANMWMSQAMSIAAIAQTQDKRVDITLNDSNDYCSNYSGSRLRGISISSE